MVRIKKENINLRTIVNDCLLKLGYSSGQASINIKGDDITVLSDSNLLCRSLHLIMENALKHAGSNPTINVTYGGTTENYFIRIEDNGPGIPENKINDIFSKYTRISRKDHQNAGTGLGLAICKQITLLLGGKVTAANLHSGGAVFEMKFHAQ